MLAVLPSIIIALLHIVLVTLGVGSLFEDTSLRNDACGKTFHVYKYATTNTAYCFFFLATFFMMPSGGESARARATLCIIMYIGFAAWGILMQHYMTASCEQVLADKFKGMYFFLLYSIVHNSLFAAFIGLHEVFLGEWLGYDLLVIFELHNKRGGGGSQNVEPHFPAPVAPPNTIPASIADATAGDATLVNVAVAASQEEQQELLKSLANKPVPASTTQQPPALNITP